MNWYFQIIIYCATERGNHHKTEHVRYSAVRTAGCKRLTGHQLKVLLQVPAGPPTDSMSSTICRIRYEVEVRTDVGNCHEFPVLRLPITIGTFPLLDSAVAMPGGSETGAPASDPRISVVSYDPGRYAGGGRGSADINVCIGVFSVLVQIFRRTSKRWL